MKVRKILIRIIQLTRFVLITLSLTMVLPDSAAAVTSADMISYYRMDNFTDSKGGPAADCSTCPSAVNGYMGGAMDFGGVAATLNVGDVDQFDWSVNASFTIEFWMKKDSACSGSNEVIVGRDDSATQLHWWIGINCNYVSPPGTAFFWLGDKNGVGSPIVGGKVLTDGKWHHMVGVRDAANNQNRLYVDGELVASLSKTYSVGFDSATAPLNMGWLNLSGGYYYAGVLDELAVYNRALTEREIRSHYYLYRGYLEACNSPIKIMPLGDSITYDSSFPHPEPLLTNRKGYRYPLWFALKAAGYDDETVDFVGSLKAGQAYEPDFDSDHAGFPGIRDDQIVDLLNSGLVNYSWDAHHPLSEPPYQETPGPYLNYNPTDIILLHIGTNGLDPSKDDVENILNEIDEYEMNSGKSVTVILARIINRKVYSPTTTVFNNNVEAMALDRIASGDKIIIVDMEDGAGLNYTTDMIDDLHPNDSGYAKMSGVWMAALDTFMPVCSTQCPAGQINDCNGVCYNASWLGDDYCDKGQPPYNADFSCMNNDYGDCPALECPAGLIPDCNDNCYPGHWVGDAICDDGTYGAVFICPEFSDDGGDCGLPGTCQGSCGWQSPSGCWCDDLCAGYNDCCADKVQMCGG